MCVSMTRTESLVFSDTDSIDLYVKDVVFVSHDASFAVLQCESVHRKEEVTVVGPVASVVTGEFIRVMGGFESHARFGRRFKAASYVPVTPDTRDGICRYLSSGLIPGIGPALAQRLVDAFGERTLEVLANESRRIMDVRGVGKKKAAIIHEAVRERRAQAETLAFVQGAGLTPRVAQRLVGLYGEDAARRLKLDPYNVLIDIRGVSFLTADRVAEHLAIAKDDPRRARAAVEFVLKRFANEGSACVDFETLASALEDLDVSELTLREQFEALEQIGIVVRDGADIYLASLFRAEVEVAKLLRQRAGVRVTRALPLLSIADDLSAEQRAAVQSSLLYKLTVLTGGPGTGKTTTLRAVCQVHAQLGQRVLLAAPTGRAAQRLSEIVDLAEAKGTSGTQIQSKGPALEGRTVHRLLEWNPVYERFERDASNPLEADLVVLDEASMLDLQLAAHLLRAIAPSSRLLLVGDADQLPPIGAGEVLKDLIESEISETTRLTSIFRQAASSGIVMAAHAIKEGQMPEVSKRGVTAGLGEIHRVDFSSSGPESQGFPPDADGRALPIVPVLDRLSVAYGLDPLRDVQILVPTRRGPCGTERLNTFLSNHFLPGRGQARFAVSDKVMQVVNDYDLGVFNGDVGFIERIEGGQTYVRFGDGARQREVQYDSKNVDNLSLAYAMTIHKSQGSEFPACVIVLDRSHRIMLRRKLLYTAVTRAKRVCVLISNEHAVRMAVEDKGSAIMRISRRSNLLSRLRDTHSTRG